VVFASKISRGNVLEHLLLQRQIGDKTLETNVLPLQVLRCQHRFSPLSANRQIGALCSVALMGLVLDTIPDCGLSLRVVFTVFAI
jgi:hypothetical protein